MVSGVRKSLQDLAAKLRSNNEGSASLRNTCSRITAVTTTNRASSSSVTRSPMAPRSSSFKSLETKKAVTTTTRARSSSVTRSTMAAASTSRSSFVSLPAQATTTTRGISSSVTPSTRTTSTRGSSGSSDRARVNEVLELFRKLHSGFKRDKELGRIEATCHVEEYTKQYIMRLGKAVNSEKRIGSVPGIHIGDQFKYKTEMVCIGMHFKPLYGIDYMLLGGHKLATCIVASEHTHGNVFREDTLIYVGEGNKLKDQQLVNGNEALYNSLVQNTDVRVVRGFKSQKAEGKIYVYIGLYKVKSCEPRRLQGNLVYHFVLHKSP